jgi:hypothetical protein
MDGEPEQQLMQVTLKQRKIFLKQVVSPKENYVTPVLGDLCTHPEQVIRLFEEAALTR